MKQQFSLQSVARLLGGDVLHGDTVLCPGLGHSRQDRSLSVRFAPGAPEGFVVHSFAGDDPLQCRDYVRQRLGWSSRFAASAKPSFGVTVEKRNPSSQDKTKQALHLWQEATPAVGTLAEVYCQSRVPGLPLEVFAADALRFHVCSPFTNRTTGEVVRLPAMIALLRDVVTDAPRGIHRTALRPDGCGKAAMPDGGEAKRMMGVAKGCAVKLSPDDEVTMGLAITEGIETGLSIYALGIRPVWAVGSAGNIHHFPVLEGVENLRIYADHDENQAGQKAAIACATRWRKAGRECRIFQPKRGGADWNDVVMEMGNVH